MIVVALNPAEKETAIQFLHAHGVMLHRSDDFQAIGRLNSEGRLIGVVAFNGFCGNVCQVHLAGDGNWVSREFIKAVFNYVFNQLNLVAIVAPIAANNLRALKFDLHFGMKEVHRVKDGWEAGVDLIILQMLKSECKYLRPGNMILEEKPWAERVVA